MGKRDKRMREGKWDVVFIQPFTGSQQVIFKDLSYMDALRKKAEYDNGMTGFAGTVILRGR